MDALGKFFRRRRLRRPPERRETRDERRETREERRETRDERKEKRDERRETREERRERREERGERREKREERREKREERREKREERREKMPPKEPVYIAAAPFRQTIRRRVPTRRREGACTIKYAKIRESPLRSPPAGSASAR